MHPHLDSEATCRPSKADRPRGTTLAKHRRPLPEPVRDAMLWLPLGVLLVPFAMVWGGASRRTALLVALALAGLSVLLWVILRLTGMSLHHLDHGDGARHLDRGDRPPP